MLKAKWSEVPGLTNLGEDDERVMAIRHISASTGLPVNEITIAFCAFGGVKTVDIAGAVNDCPLEDVAELVEDMHKVTRDSYEVAVPVITADGKKALVAIDSYGDIVYAKTEDKKTMECAVTGSEEFDASSMELLDFDLLELFNFA